MQDHNQELPPLPGEPLNVSPVERAMLAIVYPVNVVGSRASDGTLNVMLADWVMQVSFKPRMVAVSIENDARTLRFIRETGVFSVNMLHEKDGRHIAKKVVMPAEGTKIKGRSEAQQQTVNKLDGLKHVIGEDGCPVLEDALGWFRCEVDQFVEAGDHTVVLARVIDGDILRAGEALTEKELGWEYAG